MDEPQSLDSLFKEKIFRIPDYQRGYAWQTGQLKDFWEDLINLSDDRSHYTGVLTLKAIDSKEISDTDYEYWLVDDHSYKMYHVVDGQQRMTTFVVFLQAFIDFVKQLDDNSGKSDQDIYITDSLSIEAVISRYLYMTKPTGDRYRTYKFGYTKDNPSYEYLRHKIFKEDGTPLIEETLYTLNLKNARIYFFEQLKGLYSESRIKGLQEIYKKLTRRFLFNEYVIKDEFDVFVAFEAINNRGKRLSKLELLKNRLIYLTTLYTDDELDDAERQSLRNAINGAWKEIYYQLGRNDKQPLNDDEFLKAHWIMYFQYSRNRGDDFIDFLLEEHFIPQRVHKINVREVAMELPEEELADDQIDDSDYENDIEDTDYDENTVDKLHPSEIKQYVNSLKESVVHWFNSHFPHLASGLSAEEIDALDQLQRIRMGFFRPLVMSVFKNEKNSEKRTELLKYIERYIFLVHRLTRSRSYYKNSLFYRASHEFDRGELTLEGIKAKLDACMSYCFYDGETFDSTWFYDYLLDKFKRGMENGYYGWDGLRYFLYEYELKLLSQSRQKKVSWEDLRKSAQDKVSIEHVFPQTPTDDWKAMFADVEEEDYPLYSGSLGNLLLLSMSINSSLQNDTFEDKKEPKFDDAGNKIRNGYLDGSHSEIEVAQHDKWTPTDIEERGMRLLNFMEERWDIKFEDEKDKKELLFPKKKRDSGE